MTQSSQVEFSTDAKEFQTSVHLLIVNREDLKDTDIAEIEVGADSIGLRAVGTESSVDGSGKQPGVARLPSGVLSKLGDLATTFKKRTITISLQDGVAKIETTSVKNPGITLGAKSTSPISIPVNATAVDILATVEVMPKADISDAGLKARLIRSIEERDVAVETAFEALKGFGVEKAEIFELVQQHIKEMAKGVKKSLGKRRGLHSV